jgi:WD40 repeat protein
MVTFLFVCRGHQSFIFSLKINAEPQMSKKYADVIESTKWFLYTGSYDGTVKRWDVSTGECVMTYELEYGSDNPRLRAGIVLRLEIYESLFFTVTVDTVLRAWNRDDGEVNWESRDHKQSITGMQIRDRFEKSDEFRIYESPAELFTCSTDKTVRVWEPLTGICKRILRFDTQPLYAMFVRLDGALFVGAGASLIYCNGETGQAIRAFTCRHGAVKAIVADESRVYAGTGFVSSQFNIENGFKERTFGGHKGVITAVCLHDRTLYTTGDDAVVTWDTDPALFACMDGDLKTLRVLLAGTEHVPPVDPELRAGSGNSALLLAGVCVCVCACILCVYVYTYTHTTRGIRHQRSLISRQTQDRSKSSPFKSPLYSDFTLFL